MLVYIRERAKIKRKYVQVLPGFTDRVKHQRGVTKPQLNYPLLPRNRRLLYQLLGFFCGETKCPSPARPRGKMLHLRIFSEKHDRGGR